MSTFKNLPAPICEILGFAVQKKDEDLDLVDEKLACTNLKSSLNNSNQALNEIEERSATFTNKDLNENDSSIEVLSMIK